MKPKTFKELTVFDEVYYVGADSFEIDCYEIKEITRDCTTGAIRIDYFFDGEVTDSILVLVDFITDVACGESYFSDWETAKKRFKEVLQARKQRIENILANEKSWGKE